MDFRDEWYRRLDGLSPTCSCCGLQGYTSTGRSCHGDNSHACRNSRCERLLGDSRSSSCALPAPCSREPFRKSHTRGGIRIKSRVGGVCFDQSIQGILVLLLWLTRLQFHWCERLLGDSCSSSCANCCQRRFRESLFGQPYTQMSQWHQEPFRKSRDIMRRLKEPAPLRGFTSNGHSWHGVEAGLCAACYAKHLRKEFYRHSELEIKDIRPDGLVAQ